MKQNYSFGANTNYIKHKLKHGVETEIKIQIETQNETQIKTQFKIQFITNNKTDLLIRLLYSIQKQY